jgi:hypothetical protein
MFMIMTSGAMFHLSATMFKSAGIDEVMKENPDLAKDVAAAMARSAEKRVVKQFRDGRHGCMMGNLFKSGSSSPWSDPIPTTSMNFSKKISSLRSDASEPGSLLDEIDEDSRKVVMDI